jgi:hypothetical protein
MILDGQRNFANYTTKFIALNLVMEASFIGWEKYRARLELPTCYWDLTLAGISL